MADLHRGRDSGSRPGPARLPCCLRLVRVFFKFALDSKVRLSTSRLGPAGFKLRPPSESLTRKGSDSDTSRHGRPGVPASASFFVESPTSQPRRPGQRPDSVYSDSLAQSLSLRVQGP